MLDGQSQLSSDRVGPTASRRRIRDTCRVRAPKVFFCGLVGAVAVVAFVCFAHALGLRDTGAFVFLGQLVTKSAGARTAHVGLLVFLAAAGACAFGYAIIFWSAHRSGALVGAVLALFHWVISGFATGLVPALGFFYLAAGMAPALAFFVAHLVYGAAVGAAFDRLSILEVLPRPITDSLAGRQTEWSLSQRTRGSMS